MIDLLVHSFQQDPCRMRMEAIAEGIETRQQLSQTHAFGCNDGQVFLLSKPLPRDAATQLIRNGPAWISPN